MDNLQRFFADIAIMGKGGYELLGGSGSGTAMSYPSPTIVWRKSWRAIIFIIVATMVITMVSWSPNDVRAPAVTDAQLEGEFYPQADKPSLDDFFLDDALKSGPLNPVPDTDGNVGLPDPVIHSDVLDQPAEQPEGLPGQQPGEQHGEGSEEEPAIPISDPKADQPVVTNEDGMHLTSPKKPQPEIKEQQPVPPLAGQPTENTAQAPDIQPPPQAGDNALPALQEAHPLPGEAEVNVPVAQPNPPISEPSKGEAGLGLGQIPPVLPPNEQTSKDSPKNEAPQTQVPPLEAPQNGAPKSEALPEKILPMVAEPKETPPEDRRLVILAPANTPNPNLCKFMVSAIALGYPSPIIVNWGRDPFEMSKWKGGPNLSKISGVMRYLDAVLHPEAHPDDRLHKDDIVIIADGFDVWFQLPPAVLLKRYHDSNARANARLLQQWKSDEPMPMQQTIIVSSQKRCWPTVNDGSNLHCDELPQSPLRKDLYGPDTDIIIEPDNFHNVRPRFINGGVYIGAAGDLRRMFRRAFDKVDSETSKGVHLFSEQGITGEVLGEQETWRNWKRKHKSKGTDAMALMERDFEYHIGLDYRQELSIATCHAERDGQIIALNNQSAIDVFSTELGISPVRVQGIPKDIKKASNPLKGLVQSPDWGEMPLYTDFFTESVPTILHHNAWKENMKERRVWWWDRMWFFPHLRGLLSERLKPAALVPLAKVKTEDRNIVYWAPQSDAKRRKPRLLVDKAFEPLGEIEFDAICRLPEETVYSKQHWWDEVFRDGQGPI